MPPFPLGWRPATPGFRFSGGGGGLAREKGESVDSSLRHARPPHDALGFTAVSLGQPFPPTQAIQRLTTAQQQCLGAAGASLPVAPPQAQ